MGLKSSCSAKNPNLKISFDCPFTPILHGNFLECQHLILGRVGQLQNLFYLSLE
jgi:hypothetical protein